MLNKFYAVLIVVLFSFIWVACAGAPDDSNGNLPGKGGTNIGLQGAGATFPFPLYSKWISEYNKINPNIKIDYQSIGSGGGIKQITEQTVDFGASDAPMTEDQLKALKKPLFHIPTVLGAVVVCYNLPSVTGELKLTPEVLTAIFLGEVKKWNDPKVAEINPDLKLPDKEITVVHRSDGSGTTAVFVDYLSKVSKTWAEKVGKGTSVNWPVGLGGKGNEGVTGQVKQVEGSIGYTELVYALQNKISFASIKNKSGKFVLPSADNVTAAAAGTVGQLPDDMRVSITDAEGDTAYPISSYTYLLVYQDMSGKVKAESLAKFLKWATTDGQKIAKDLNYAPLPEEVIKKVTEKINSLKANGEALSL
ncbi:MAG: phosphate ABC transporter substrate-binding protein PstS [Acidobacteria bacterium]|nr:phosphate ABC transporter substrate-binding protein PstS [Acidobacteriota bacterium]